MMQSKCVTDLVLGNTEGGSKDMYIVKFVVVEG